MFEPISLAGSLPTKDINDLITDQRYFRVICIAIDKGSLFKQLSITQSIMLNHARWLTTVQSATFVRQY